MGVTALALLASACGGDEFQGAGSGGAGAGAAGGSQPSGGSSAGGTGPGGSSAGGSSAGGSFGGAGGAAGTSNAGASGGPTDRCPGPANLALGEPTYHSTLDDLESLTNPVTGQGTGALVSTDPINDFVDSECQAGLRINAGGEHFTIPEKADAVENIDYRRGSLGFFFVSSFDAADNKRHVFFSTVNKSGPSGFLFEKSESNELRFVVTPTSGAAFPARVAAGSFTFSAGERVHLLVSWEFGLGNGLAPVKIYLDGNQLDILGTPLNITMRGSDAGSQLRFGSLEAPNTFAGGVFDDLRIYSAPIDK